MNKDLPPTPAESWVSLSIDGRTGCGKTTIARLFANFCEAHGFEYDLRDSDDTTYPELGKAVEAIKEKKTKIRIVTGNYSRGRVKASAKPWSVGVLDTLGNAQGFIPINTAPEPAHPFPQSVPVATSGTIVETVPNPTNGPVNLDDLDLSSFWHSTEAVGLSNDPVW